MVLIPEFPMPKKSGLCNFYRLSAKILVHLPIFEEYGKHFKNFDT